MQVQDLQVTGFNHCSEQLIACGGSGTPAMEHILYLHLINKRIFIYLYVQPTYNDCACNYTTYTYLFKSLCGAVNKTSLCTFMGLMLMYNTRSA